MLLVLACGRRVVRAGDLLEPAGAPRSRDPHRCSRDDRYHCRSFLNPIKGGHNDEGPASARATVGAGLWLGFMPAAAALKHLKMDFSGSRSWTSRTTSAPCQKILPVPVPRTHRRKLTRQNMASLLAKYVGPGDLLIDLAWNIDAARSASIGATTTGVLSINTSRPRCGTPTSRQKQAPNEEDALPPPSPAGTWRRGRRNGPTVVGRARRQPRSSISHLSTKVALDRHRRGHRRSAVKPRARLLARRQQPTQCDYDRRWRATGAKVIHFSERDTQIADLPKAVDEFVNTWSSSFWEEGIDAGRAGLGHARAVVARQRTPRVRPAESNLPRTAGHGHVGAVVGAVRRDRRHGDPPRRGVHDHRSPHRVWGRAGVPIRPYTTLYMPSDGPCLAPRNAHALQLPVECQPCGS